MKKFNAIIGNPPFSEDSPRTDRSAKRGGKQLWQEFTRIALNHTTKTGITALITPDNWLCSNFYAINRKLRHSNITNTFPIEFSDAAVSARCWIVNHKSNTITDFDGYKVDLRKLLYYPLNGKYVSIFEKVLQHIQFKITNFNSNNHDSIEIYNKDIVLFEFKEGVDNRQHSYKNLIVSSHKTTTCPHEVYDSSFKKVWWSISDTWFDQPKVMVLLNSTLQPKFSQTNGCTNALFYCIIENAEAGASLVSYLNTKLAKFLVKTTVSRQSNSRTVLKYFPRVPLDREWTDEEIYNHFNLTDDEVKMIEEVIK